MNPKDLQTLIGTPADGIFGPASRGALKSFFVNLHAKAITPAEITAFATRLGCSEKQIRAVSMVESSGGGYDAAGRPKILFERHLFHNATGGKWSITSFSNPDGGGYKEDSWEKLGLACGKDPDAAFASCSWGKFQVLGKWWKELGYKSALDLALSTRGDEVAHYELFFRYIEKFGLTGKLRAISTNPKDNVPFVLAYNGKNGVEQNQYDRKLASAMK